MNSAKPSRSLRDAARWSGRRGAIFAVAALPVLGCSFQDFTYLQESHTGSGGSVGTGGAGGAGGTGNPDGSAGTSGMPAEASADSTAADVVDGASLADAGDVTDTGSVITDSGSVNVLVNAGFEQGLTGWAFEPMTAEGKYAFTQYPVGTATTPEGQYELATWHGTDAYRIRIFQTFTSLESGRYTFKGWFNRGEDNAAFVYSAGCGGADQQTAVPLTSATEWLQVGIGGINVTTGQCEVGFVVDANPSNWLNADAFTFERDPQ